MLIIYLLDRRKTKLEIKSDNICYVNIARIPRSYFKTITLKNILLTHTHFPHVKLCCNDPVFLFMAFLKPFTDLITQRRNQVWGNLRSNDLVIMIKTSRWLHCRLNLSSIQSLSTRNSLVIGG